MTHGWMQKHRKSLLIGVPLLFIVCILLMYFMTGRYVSTDNAYVQAAKAGVNSNVPGQVINVFVKENQRVKKDEPLFALDDRPYKIALEGAKAQLLDTHLKILVLKANYYIAFANKVGAENNLMYAELEYKRQQSLSASGISSDMVLDKVKNDYQLAKEQYNAAEQTVVAALANLNNDPEIPLAEHPLVQEAQANLDHAKLNLEYTTIIAPFDGIVTKVDLLQPGDFINSGQPVFALISDSNIWVDANFKETQITHMKPGQSVTISVDAYPDHDFTGKVLSLSPGTGSTFALLPPENATGNWVKIVQRLPVRISIESKNDASVMLASGLSATVTVDTKL